MESLDGPIIFAKELPGIPQQTLHAQVVSGSGDVWAWMLQLYRDSCGRRVGVFKFIEASASGGLGIAIL